jgi:hypothetical protein
MESGMNAHDQPHEEEWRNGWLYSRNHPEGIFWPANVDEVVVALEKRVATLEKLIRAVIPDVSSDV